MPVLNHVHKYILKNLGTRKSPRKVYACDLPGCSHHMPSKSLVLHKKSICWQCEKEFIITQNILTRNIVKPRCVNCRTKKPKDAQVDNAIDMLLAMRG